MFWCFLDKLQPSVCRSPPTVLIQILVIAVWELEKLSFIVAPDVCPSFHPIINNSVSLLLRDSLQTTHTHAHAHKKKKGKFHGNQPISPNPKRLTALLTVQSLLNQRVYMCCDVPAGRGASLQAQEKPYLIRSFYNRSSNAAFFLSNLLFFCLRFQNKLCKLFMSDVWVSLFPFSSPQLVFCGNQTVIIISKVIQERSFSIVSLFYQHLRLQEVIYI